jgi:hypothetical protein
MIRKSSIAYFIFLLATLYIITPWFFEKTLFFNEILAAIGFVLLAYKRFKVGNDLVSVCVVLLLGWCGVHLITSLFRKDSMYFYLRNSIIFYSIFAFYIGFYCLKYLEGFLLKIRSLLRYYVGIFLFIPLPLWFYERFGVSMLFPSLFKNSRYRLLPFILVTMNFIYSFTYESSTAFMIGIFLLLIYISPGYKFFKQCIVVIVLAAALLFIYLQPNLALIKNQFSTTSNNAIMDVKKSNPLLSIDANTTWRLVLWKQIITDRFPENIFGLGFGTPAVKYFPVEDYRKVKTLPYVMGAHNSFIYLFGRLGIIYLLLALFIYTKIFQEYFYYKSYYYSNNQVLIFWSFFVISVITLFNPVLETPLFAAAYWLLLGFTARCIYNRKLIENKLSSAL